MGAFALGGTTPAAGWGGLTYGLLGFPLAFVALPLYVVLPHHYAQNHAVPLATLGAILLCARLGDALVDPLIGRWMDRVFADSARLVWRFACLAAGALALGLWGLFMPLAPQGGWMVLWVGLGLVLTYLAYSVLSIAHQSWGARLGGDEAQRGQVVAWREGTGLLGVVVAAALPVWSGVPALLVVFAGTLALGCWALRLAPQPAANPAALLSHPPASVLPLVLPWRNREFRRLMAAYVFNGVAGAMPATLVLFFIQDLLQAPPQAQAAYLGGYFLAAALGLPLWLCAVRWLGLSRTWLLGMGVSVLAFVWAGFLKPGDTAAFAWVCGFSGFALGADLALPPALLAGVVQRAGAGGQHEGLYLGWWNFATKFNLALAAGLALPLLSLWGYQPGTSSPQGLQALTWAYAILPCGLKLLAAAALYFGGVVRQGSTPNSPSREPVQINDRGERHVPQ
jgi:glycoside/pentoside/hexuronide:cation symporter, GPH family